MNQNSIKYKYDETLNKVITMNSKEAKTPFFYHGSYMEIIEPDLKHSRSDIDFGKGFYLTQDNYLANKWACKYRQNEHRSFTSWYTFDYSNLNVYEFSLDIEWLDYVSSNRNGDINHTYDNYDLLIGTIADDKLYNVIDLYSIGAITPEIALKTMNCMDYGLQYVIKSEKALETLHFVKSKEFKGLEKQNLQNAFRIDTEMGAKKAEELLKQFNGGKQP